MINPVIINRKLSIVELNRNGGAEPLESEIHYRFDSNTQFTLDHDTITLRQGSVRIADGQFADWLILFQTFSGEATELEPIQISQAIEGVQVPDSESIVIQISGGSVHQLKIDQSDLHSLEERLIELGQGCCDPSPYNFVADIGQEPDEILGLIQKITSFSLSPEQLQQAKASIKVLPSELEITVLDLYQLWETIPELSAFAKALRFYFLPA